LQRVAQAKRPIDGNGNARDQISQGALRRESDDNRDYACAREQRGTHRSQHGYEVRIQDKDDDPNQHRAELLQKTDGGAIDMALAGH
jgi:hypothetical protein